MFLERGFWVDQYYRYLLWGVFFFQPVANFLIGTWGILFITSSTVWPLRERPARSVLTPLCDEVHTTLSKGLFAGHLADPVLVPREQVRLIQKFIMMNVRDNFQSIQWGLFISPRLFAGHLAFHRTDSSVLFWHHFFIFFPLRYDCITSPE